MNHSSIKCQCCGFTLMEVVVVIATVGIVTLGAGVLLANSQKGWGDLYGRVYGDPAIDGYTAQRAFDSVCRKASTRKYVLSTGGDALELYFWDDGSTAETPENYARFYQDNDQMLAEYGKTQSGTWQPDASEPTTTSTLAANVQSLKFTVQGSSIQMYLTYTDTDMLPVICSSVRHND